MVREVDLEALPSPTITLQLQVRDGPGRTHMLSDTGLKVRSKLITLF